MNQFSAFPVPSTASWIFYPWSYTLNENKTVYIRECMSYGNAQLEEVWIIKTLIRLYWR